MISEEVLAGYLLEEVLASLIQSAGYRLITSSSQDCHELTSNRSGDLQVKGRGAAHQVDVLGELTIVPAFSQPLRLIVEAKARNRAMSISVVRNAVGTVNDVNEAWMVDYSQNHARRHYRYALFATNGFSKVAQNYAMAHQIALVDLSGPEWAFLRDAVSRAASDLIRAVPSRWRGPYPVRRLRAVLRDALKTAPDGTYQALDPDGPERTLQMLAIAAEMRSRLDEGVDGALLAFPAGQQVLLARPDDLGAFLARAGRDPEHRVSLSLARDQGEGHGRTWVVRPIQTDDGNYSLRVTLPAVVEERALAESDRRNQVRSAKDDLGGRLDVYWDPRREEGVILLSGPRLFRLSFASVDLRQPRRE